MAKRIVIIHSLAEKEYRTALRWYARRSAWAAHRFEEAVDQVVERIASAAIQGTPFKSRFRWMRTKRFPFLLYYDVPDSGPVWVYAVAHGRRKLGYWLRRARP
jgi:hypothetical protein